MPTEITSYVSDVQNGDKTYNRHRLLICSTETVVLWNVMMYSLVTCCPIFSAEIQHAPLKCWYLSIRLQSIISQKIINLMLTYAITSNAACSYAVYITENSTTG